MSVSIYVEVSGRTYDVKEKLKSLGLRWDGDRKVWKGTVSEEALRKLDKLADRFPIEIETREIEIRTRKKRYELTYDDEDDLVRCWVCGRLVPRSQATKDTNGEWYCGC